MTHFKADHIQKIVLGALILMGVLTVLARAG